MNKNFTLILLFIIFLPTKPVAAQFHLPSMDIQMKSGAAILTDMIDKYNNLYSYTAPLIYAELNWNISQHFAAGAFLTAGVYSKSNFAFTGEYGSSNTSYGSSHLAYGIKLRASSGRQPRFRPFAEFSYGKLEMDLEKNVYRISNSTNFFGISFGLMIRLGSKLYLVLPQTTLRIRKNGFFFEHPGDYLFSSYPLFIELTGGLSYNIGKKK